MIISIEAAKAFNKIQHRFMIKSLKKTCMEGPYLSVIKGIYDKPITSIILSGEKLEAFLLKPGTRQYPLLFNTLLQTLARAMKQEK